MSRSRVLLVALVPGSRYSSHMELRPGRRVQPETQQMRSSRRVISPSACSRLET